MSETVGLLSCGHSLDQLNDYLLAGRTPADPTIDSCPECQAALQSLRRLNAFTEELIQHDSQAHGEEDLDWLGSIFTNIALEAKAGRDIPLAATGAAAEAVTDPEDELGQSEGAVIALIRAAGDELDGAIIGRCRLTGEVSEPGAPIRVEIRVTAVWGPPLQELAEQLRLKVRTTLEQHTQLNLSGVDITIVDIQRMEAGTDE